jgi:hypothetical protein
MKRWALLILLLARSAAADVAKTSLATETDREAWREPGFRLALGLGYGQLVGLGGTPSGRLVGPVLRTGVRLDAAWSLMGSFQYLAVSENGGLKGLRFAGTIEPTWHFASRFSLALGVGFGGLVEGRTGRRNPDPQPGSLVSSYTFPDAHTPLPSCSGDGITGLVRVDWMREISHKTALGMAFEVLGQWTGCVDDSGRVEPDTATPIVRRQWWPHIGATLAWLVAWR